LTYPVQPAAEVFYPPAEAIKELLAGGIVGHTPLAIGTLIARRDVDIAISADRVVARHMAILAMTGGGKTVAARRILRELIDLGYPLLILDPHGDYLGLWQKRKLFKDTKVRLLYPHIAMTEQNRHIVEILISKMTEGLTEPQREELAATLSEVEAVDGESVLRYIKRLREVLNRKIGQASDRRKLPTLSVCRRQLGVVENRLDRMELTNERMRQRLPQLEFEKMPDPEGRPEGVIAPRTVSILYLGGYDHLTQTTIASIVLEALYEHRANLSNRVPPFLAVVEEAHTFIPSSREGAADVPSLETIRKLITEGRKFGTGLMLISQRPSRVDETILSQCNSFLILRLVNPRDQNFVKQIMENLSEQDARMLPGFGPGQGIISGQAVRFPLLVRIKMDEDLIFDGLGDENFLQQAKGWKPDKGASVRERVAGKLQRLSQLPERRPKGGKSNRGPNGGSGLAAAEAPLRDSERWDKVRKGFAEDARAMGDLEAATGTEWDRARRAHRVADYAGLSWQKLKARGISNPRREALLQLLEAVGQPN
jgi:DNA helicase HerA-like ATPase